MWLIMYWNNTRNYSSSRLTLIFDKASSSHRRESLWERLIASRSDTATSGRQEVSDNQYLFSTFVFISYMYDLDYTDQYQWITSTTRFLYQRWNCWNKNDYIIVETCVHQQGTIGAAQSFSTYTIWYTVSCIRLDNCQLFGMYDQENTTQYKYVVLNTNTCCSYR
jgi:hypothetical protein